MSYEFGSAASDDVTWPVTFSLPVGNSAFLVCGWFRPTTLTAGRGLWSFGNVTSARIASTTSEITLFTDNTTDGQWTTTGANLAVNTWSFLAFFLTANNTGPVGLWKVWSTNSLNAAPSSLAITQNTAPVGNFVGSNSFYIGNVGTSTTLAFQGQISSVQIYQGGHNAIGVFRPGTAGTLSAEQEEFLLNTFVFPAWNGTFFPFVGSRTDTSIHDWATFVAPLDFSPMVKRFTTAGAQPIAGTVSGAVLSSESPPTQINSAFFNNFPGSTVRR